MKNLNIYLIERLKLTKDSKLQTQYKYFPKDNNELEKNIIEIVKDTIKNNNRILDLNCIDISNITDMELLFYSVSIKTSFDEYIDEIVLNNWNTENVTNMSKMFYYLENIKKIDVSNFNVENVTTMMGMFANNINLIDIGNLSKWNTKNLKNTSVMFSDCKKLKTIGDIDNWDVRKLKDGSLMFSGCYLLTNIGDISNWKLENIANMVYAFEHCKKLNYVGNLDEWEHYAKMAYDKHNDNTIFNGLVQKSGLPIPYWLKS